MGSNKHWIVTDKAIHKQIQSARDGWDEVRREASKLCDELGATLFAYNTSFTRLFVAGFQFPPDSKIDAKQWVKLKGVDARRPAIRVPQ